MHILNRICLTGLSVVLVSCASTAGTNAEAVANANDEGLICKKEAKVGSKLGHMVCTTRAEREEAARITEELRRNLPRSGVTQGEITPDR